MKVNGENDFLKGQLLHFFLETVARLLWILRLGGKIALFDLSNAFRVDKWRWICVLETCQVGKHVSVVIFSRKCNVFRYTAHFSALTISCIELLC